MNKEKNKFNVWIRNHFEFLIIPIIAIIILSFLFFSFKDILFNLYLSTGLNESLLNISSILLGLLITSYAIVFSIVPTINRDLLEADLFLRINSLFFISIILNMLILILSIIIKFLPVNLLIIINLFFSIVLIELVLFIVIITYLLFKISRNDTIKNNNNISTFINHTPNKEDKDRVLLHLFPIFIYI